MDAIITIGEYVEYYQPDVAAVLWGQAKVLPLRAVLDLPFMVWKAVMEERPKPGRAGLLLGEVVVVED